jgi:hypothetical protein
MVDFIFSFLRFWGISVFLGFVLIFFRSDAERVGEDIDTYFIKKPFFAKALTVFLLICVLPISIPFSLANIIKRKK